MTPNQDHPESEQPEDQDILAPKPRFGIVYTRERIVNLCLDLLEKQLQGELLEQRILDVGCGYGQFCGPLAKRLGAESRHKEMPWSDFRDRLLNGFRGVEIRPETADIARSSVAEAIEAQTGGILQPKALEIVIQEADFLAWDPEPPHFDAIVGNIPYVRYDQIPKLNHGTDLSYIRDNFSTFKGRADYSVPFLERITELLEPDGVAVLISSNRFTRAEYGQAIRAHVANSDHQLHEIDLSDIRAFSSEVSAYASVFLLTPADSSESVYARLLTDREDLLSRVARNFPENQGTQKEIEVTSRGALSPQGRPWSTLPDLITGTLKRLSNEFEPLSKLDITLRKGPATGANSIFIREWAEFPLTEETKKTHLLPLFHWGSRDGDNSDKADKYLLSVFERGTKRLLSIKELPEDISTYLQEHKEDLETRHIVSEQGRSWWRTIDKFDPGLKEETKILIPDLRLSDRTVLDEGVWFPSHTVVYVTSKDERLLRGLTRILRSPVTDEYRFWRSPDMGRKSPRASSRMLREFPVPPAKKLRAIGAGEAGDVEAYELYGLTEEEVDAFETRRIQRRADRSGSS